MIRTTLPSLHKTKGGFALGSKIKETQNNMSDPIGQEKNLDSRSL
jgi:hypothetical protein